MQKRFWDHSGNYVHSLQLLPGSRNIIAPTLQVRGLATRKPPGFGASTPPSTGPHSRHSKSPKTSDSQTSSKGKQTTAPQSTAEAKKTSRRLPIGPGKLILFSVLAYLGYRVYTWQTDPRRSRVLDPRNFTPFILEVRKKVSSTSSILSLLSLPRGQNTENIAEAWRTGVWSVQVMQPELQIARSYTPLPPAEDAEPEQLRLFVRKEPQGEVSTFLHKISRGTLVHCRGPQIEYTVPEDVEEVLFLAGGTGIAPALQVAHTLYNCRPSTSVQGPRMQILWANRRREDSYFGLDPFSPEQQPAGIVPKVRNLTESSQGRIAVNGEMPKEDGPILTSRPQNPLVDEVEALKSKYPDKVTVEYLVDDESSYISEGLLRNYLGGIAQVSQQSAEVRPNGKKLVLISGPEGFINFYAGPKSMKGGREIQGPLGGILQKIEPPGWEIWKL